MPTFYDRFRECAELWPEHIALEIQRRDRLESYRYREVKQMAESVGHWLVENGFQPGARIAIFADNHPRWVTVYLGIIAAGCTAVPLDTALRPNQVVKLLNDSGSSLLFCDSRNYGVASQAVNGMQVGIVLIEGGSGSVKAEPVSQLDAIFAAGAQDFSPVAVSSESVAALLYTSGTTADPKGVMLTHANLMGEVEGVFAVLRIGPQDAVLGLLPLFHALAQMANLLLPLVTGARVVYLETLNTNDLLRAFRERKITAFAVVPQFFYLIHERIFKEISQRGKIVQFAVRGLMSLNRMLRRLGLNGGGIFFRQIHQAFGGTMRYLITGGSRFDPQVGREFSALGIDILQAYGLTETTGGAFLTSPDDNVVGSVGRPLPGSEGRIIDSQASEEDSQPVGEIAIRGPIVMKGYWNRPDATSAVLKDGWLHTGDLGYFDTRGNLFITGRMKEVIVLSNGKNIYPEEIETHYLNSPFIKEICVVGLEARPGDAMSDRLHAVIVPNFELLRQRKIVNAKEVIRFDIEGLSAKLPSTKRIGSYEIWQQDLPRTTTRKLKRFEIEKQIQANAAQGLRSDSEIASEKPLTAEDAAWLDQPEVQRALEIIRQATKTKSEELHPSDSLELDLGFDSMQRVELLVALEQELGGKVDESRASEIYTVRELVDLVRESAASGTAGSSREQFAGWRAVLQEEPVDPEALALALAARRPFAEIFWFVLSRIVRLFADDRFNLHLTGLEHLPARGPYIISSNHQSFLDPVILSSVLPSPVFRQLFSVGTSEIFGSGFMRVLARSLRVVVVDPDANLISAMRAGAFGLRDGRILMLYPEGQRSIDGKPTRFKKGAAILSIHRQVPIVPVAIEGFHEAWPRGKRFQKLAPLRIKFGEPIYPPPETEASEIAYETLTGELRRRIVEMWEELRKSGT
ncbi:MAG TPA: AMP-binding protein [Terriglobales bacterium]|nr:AMP-binding protein [Terriglobales bacterium]